MQIIPVIDLQNGVVVHARLGDRKNYAPLISVICKKPELFEAIETYHRLFGFDVIYIADLNAITGQGNNQDILNEALVKYPKIRFWIDAGYPSTHFNLKRYGNYLPVVGSESLQDDTLNVIKIFDKNLVLSLDFDASGPIGTKQLFNSPEYWPDNVIIMTLAKVGSNSGPDLEKLADYQNRYPKWQFIAAGGIRNTADLNALKNIGIEHALVATALHNGSLKPSDISGLL
jgi:phosphoribosylformimino-5-aminoimidazole carboxamide ribotide isomerase